MMPDQGGGEVLRGGPAGRAISMDCFTTTVMDNGSRPRNIFFYPEVDTEGVAELKHLKERELKRKRISWKLTMMPLKEENEVILFDFFLIKSCSPGNAQQSWQIHRTMPEPKAPLVHTRAAHVKLAEAFSGRKLKKKGIMSVY